MQLTTLMDILEREIGVSPSARSTLAQMVAERAEKPTGAQPSTPEPAAERVGVPRGSEPPVTRKR
jgi:hypothetical protein